jgi:hypothetical protein
MVKLFAAHAFVSNSLKRISCFFHLAILLLIAISGCATFEPKPFDETRFLTHAVTKSDGDISVTADVLTPEESKEVFGAELSGEGIQPVWIEIENSGLYPYWFVPHRLDAEYYSAMEIANIIHGSASGDAKKKIYDHFYDIRMTRYIPPGETRRGFVFTKFEQGLKHLAIKIIGKDTVKQFYFALEIPGPEMDFQKVDFDYLFEHQVILDLDLPGFRRELEKLPCCASNAKGTSFGDPLNLVIVGDRMLVMSELLSSGWNLTETIRAGSVYKMILSSVFGKRYLTAPISPLYFHGRQQDFAMQKTRSDINRRNHLRLWLSPMTVEGRPVWIGQISRDIGIKFTTKSPYLVTHEISANVDEARFYIVEELIASHSVEMIGYVRGLEPASHHAPRQNLTGDDYFTDGLRAVIFLQDKYIPFNEITWLEWENPENW